MKYVTFKFFNKVARINRDNIVGFYVPDPLVLWTEVLLDSGASVPLNGMALKEAEDTLAEFDKQCGTK